METVALHCNFLWQRIDLFEQTETLECEIEQAVICLVWASTRLDLECDEITSIKLILNRKFGDQIRKIIECEKEKPKNLWDKFTMRTMHKVFIERYLIGKLINQC